jgi:hypothetical protein
MHNITKLVDIISINRDSFCKEILAEMNAVYPTFCPRNAQKCCRDINAVLDAIVNDIVANSNSNLKSLALTYVYSYSGFRYNTRLTQTIYALNLLRDKLICRILPGDHIISTWVVQRFSFLTTIISDRVMRELKWWDFSARSLPLIVIATFMITTLFEWKAAEQYVINTSLIIFFSVSVMWWWWAIGKIALIVISFNQVKQTFSEVVSEINNIKDTIK